MTRYDALIVGAGHNGLVTACYLAKAGLRTLVVEKNDWVGGAAVSRSIYPGFTYSNCSYVSSLLRPEIMRDLDLPAHGLQILPYEVAPSSLVTAAIWRCTATMTPTAASSPGTRSAMPRPTTAIRAT